MLIATRTAVHTFAAGQDWPRRLCQGPVARTDQAGERIVAAMQDGTVLFFAPGGATEVRSDIAGHITSLLLLPGRQEVLIGTEPPHLYLQGGQGPARRVEAFDRLECRRRWRTPWGGPPAVRSLAGTPDGWVYADIHVGSIMRSPDAGVSWAPVGAGLDEDVHQVATCPGAPHRVYANTAQAVYVSDDRGHAWQHRSNELEGRYGRAIAVYPQRPDWLLASVSDGPHEGDVHAELYRTTDAGRHWLHVTEGFPPSGPANIDTYHLAFSGDGDAWAAIDHTLYLSTDAGHHWRKAWQADEPIRMLVG